MTVRHFKVWRGDVMKGRERATLETRVRVVAGRNELVAYAFNGDDVKSAMNMPEEAAG